MPNCVFYHVFYHVSNCVFNHVSNHVPGHVNQLPFIDSDVVVNMFVQPRVV
jgi:hypothetical protein